MFKQLWLGWKAEQHGARFILVSLTGGIELAPSHRVKGEYPGVEGEQYNLAKPIKILGAFSKKASVDYLPLLPVFRTYLKEHQVPIERLHYACDGHWTPLA